MDFKNPAINIRPSDFKAAHTLRDGYKPERLKCRRCKRDLPDDCFQSLGFSSDRKVMFLHPHCDTCRKQAKSKWSAHPLITPAVHRYVDKMVWGARSGAKKRGLVFGIETDDMLEMYVLQSGRCSLSGELMTIGRGGRILTEARSASIDRIDSAGNYTLDNIHLVCRAINVMKNEMSLQDFGGWCQRVVLHALREADKRAA